MIAGFITQVSTYSGEYVVFYLISTALGCVVAYVSYLLIASFGELVESISKIANTSPPNTNISCNCSHSVNDTSVIRCDNCGIINAKLGHIQYKDGSTHYICKDCYCKLKEKNLI